MTGSEQACVSKTANEVLKKIPLFFEESGSMTIENLQGSIRKLVHLHKTKVVFIDYLQLLSTGRRIDNRQQEIATISRNIKLLAKELDICIICLSQLSRKVEERPDKTPHMSDLRESGSIEQDADQVMLLYRPDYYTQVGQLSLSNNQNSSQNSDSLTKIIIAKNRHGKTGSVDVVFYPKIMKFSNYMDEDLSYDSLI